MDGTRLRVRASGSHWPRPSLIVICSRDSARVALDPSLAVGLPLPAVMGDATDHDSSSTIAYSQSPPS